MRKNWIFLIFLLIILSSCIQDAPLNPEADIFTFSFPQESLRRNVELGNDYVIVYPKKNIDLKSLPIEYTVSQGATSVRIDKTNSNDTLFYIQVTSESKQYTKRYSIIQVEDFPDFFNFENWIKFSSSYQFLNPKENSYQWYSSNNGIAIAWNNRNKSAEEYPVRQTNTCVSGNYGVELRTMTGPGNIAGGLRFIPCVAGSLYLGTFDILTGLTNPLKSTKFGVPFNSGKPSKFSGYYMYLEGTEDYINSDGSKNASKRDTCAIYATLYKTDKNTEYLYGDNVSISGNIIARAQIEPEDIVRGGTSFTYFEISFDYDNFNTPFAKEELMNNEYKLTIVFSSSKRGAYYEGRPGSRLIVDDVKVTWEEAL